MEYLGQNICWISEVNHHVFIFPESTQPDRIPSGSQSISTGADTCDEGHMSTSPSDWMIEVIR
jgi:hypothetical protein